MPPVAVTPFSVVVTDVVVMVVYVVDLLVIVVDIGDVNVIVVTALFIVMCCYDCQRC